MLAVSEHDAAAAEQATAAARKTALEIGVDVHRRIGGVGA